jgi:hypothetical protein
MPTTRKNDESFSGLLHTIAQLIGNGVIFKSIAIHIAQLAKRKSGSQQHLPLTHQEHDHLGRFWRKIPSSI